MNELGGGQRFRGLSSGFPRLQWLSLVGIVGVLAVLAGCFQFPGYHDEALPTTAQPQLGSEPASPVSGAVEGKPVQTASCGLVVFPVGLPSRSFS